MPISTLGSLWHSSLQGELRVHLGLRLAGRRPRRRLRVHVRRGRGRAEEGVREERRGAMAAVLGGVESVLAGVLGGSGRFAWTPRYSGWCSGWSTRSPSTRCQDALLTASGVFKVRTPQ